MTLTVQTGHCAVLIKCMYIVSSWSGSALNFAREMPKRQFPQRAFQVECQECLTGFLPSISLVR